MILKRLSVFLLASGLACSPLALTAAESKPQPPAQGEERPDDVICETVTPIGSHIKRRVCATRQARDEARKANEEDLNRIKRGSGKPNSNAARGEL